MKVVLVDPGFGPDSFGTFGQSHWSSVLHHGLCSISGYAKSKGFSDIELVDMRTLRGWDHFRRRIEVASPEVVGLTMRSCDFNVVARAVGLVKEIRPQAVTVVGGVHPTIMPHEVAQNERIDHIVVGEGEVSFVHLLQQTAAGRPSERIITGIKPNLDELPFDDRELYQYRVTLGLVSYPGIFEPPMVTMIGQRGCPFNCTFCAPHAKTMFGKKMRARSVDHIIEELKELRRRYQFKSIKFYDYTFTMNHHWVYEFCEKYRLAGFNAKILAQSRADLVCQQEEMLKELRQAGLRLLLIGFESGSQRVLDLLKKGTTVEQNLEAAQICKKHGIMLGASFMLGSPGEGKEDVRATVELVKKIRPHFTSVAYFTPVPGCELYDYCQERDLSLLASYDDLVTYAPGKPKIKGIDYAYLDAAVEEIMGSRFGGRLVGKGIKFVYQKTKSRLALRHFLVHCYSSWVSSRPYRFLESVKAGFLRA